MSVDLENNILALVEPAIEPKKLEVRDPAESAGKNDKVTKNIGIEKPVVLINDYAFSKNDVRSFILSSEGPYPMVSATLIDTKNIFGVDSFPRDGDKMTVFINSKNESTYKSIHLDFEITDISSSPAKPGNPSKINVSGKVSVPKLFAENCQSFEANTSLEHLTLVAKELKLGLASNIDETADSQIRIQPFINYLDFIKQIVMTSYISDDSFQHFFIDQYYYLNFIDINKIFNATNPSIEDFQETISSLPTTMSEEMESGTDNDNFPTKLFLTNNMAFKASNNWIEKYRILNQSNTINDIHGHFRDIQIYDDNAEERLDEFRVEALSTNPENLKDLQEPLKGNRDSEEYLDLVKRKYMGRQDVGEDGLGNVHPNFIFSQLHNRRNFDETQKIKLEVTLSTFNASLYRYMKIPVLMYHIDRQNVLEAVNLKESKEEAGFKDSAIDNGKSTEPEPEQVLDQFLSGYYIIESIDIIYKDSIGNYSQKVVLTRREWPARINSVRNAG
jgi:hypothetical protein